MGPPAAVAEVRHAVRTAPGGLAGLAGAGGPAAPPLVLVACSGGADSYALAAAVAFEAPAAGVLAGAVTVDHGLQAGSARRAAAVAGVLGGLGLDPVRAVRAEPGGDGGPEAAARRARYAALDAVAVELGAVAVLLAHTRDDQAETVLLRLARGSGARSLAAMAPVAGRYRRPLLDVPRARVRAACAAAGLEPWADPHNADPAYARPRVRHDALPALEAALGPGVAAALARSAGLLRADADALDGWAGRAYAAQVRADGATVVVAAALGSEPEAVRTRVLHRAALAAGCPAGALAATHVRALDALLRGASGGHADLPGAVGAARRRAKLVLAPFAPSAPPGGTPP